jgi:hypothetical protein
MLRLLSFCLLLPGLAVAQTGPKPDFSGTWKLSLAKSKFESPHPDSSMFQVDHREPQFHIKRTHVVRGKEYPWSIDLTTDGKEAVQKDSNGDFHVRLRWEGATLIFDSYWMVGAAKATNVVVYSLSPDGSVFTADERFTGPRRQYHNVWVFDRQ